MSLICKIFSHKWDESRKYHQECKRKKCFNARVLVFNKYPKIGEPAYEWKELDFNKLMKLKFPGYWKMKLQTIHQKLKQYGLVSIKNEQKRYKK